MLYVDPVAAEQMKQMYRMHMSVPDIDTSLDASFVCYNARLDPICFDFPYWLIDAEMTRIREGAPGPLKIYFWKGLDGNAALEDDGYRNPMFYNVIKPMLGLLGVVEDERAIHGRRKKLTSSIDIVRSHRRGETVPVFRAPYSLSKEFKKPPVVITLRECGPYSASHKNSDIVSWLRFAHYLKALGEDVVFVRDYARADEPLPGFVTYPQASTDIIFRMALYEAAKINFCVSNGPVTLCYFSKMPWIAFIMPEPDGAEYEANTPKIWREKMGVEIGGQFPWSDATQRIVWQREDYDSLVRVWKKMSPMLA